MAESVIEVAYAAEAMMRREELERLQSAALSQAMCRCEFCRRHIYGVGDAQTREKE